LTFDDERALETYRSMISVGTEALKALQLLNGGAVIALLTYLGHTSARLCLAPRAQCPVAWFVIGLLSGTAAFLTTYFTQLLLYGEFVRGDKTRHPVLLANRGPRVGQPCGICWRCVCIHRGVIQAVLSRVNSLPQYCEWWPLGAAPCYAPADFMLVRRSRGEPPADMRCASRGMAGTDRRRVRGPDARGVGSTGLRIPREGAGWLS